VSGERFLLDSRPAIASSSKAGKRPNAREVDKDWTRQSAERPGTGRNRAWRSVAQPTTRLLVNITFIIRLTRKPEKMGPVEGSRTSAEADRRWLTEVGWRLGGWRLGGWRLGGWRLGGWRSGVGWWLVVRGWYPRPGQWASLAASAERIARLAGSLS
jgi:hypothetical protein